MLDFVIQNEQDLCELFHHDNCEMPWKKPIGSLDHLLNTNNWRHYPFNCNELFSVRMYYI